MTNNLESRVEAEKIAKKIKLIGAYLGPQLKEPIMNGQAHLSTEYTDPIVYLDAVREYAVKARKKIRGDALDEMFTFDVNAALNTSIKKSIDYTIKDYIKDAKELGIDFSKYDISDKYQGKKYLEVIKEFKRKQEDNKIKPVEDRLYKELMNLRGDIVTKLDEEITNFAKKQMYDPAVRALKKARTIAEKDPTSKEAKSLKRMDYIKQTQKPEELGEEYRNILGSLGIPGYK